MSGILLRPLVALLVSVLVALYAGPRLVRAALRYGMVDRPHGPLKTHSEPVPHLGGLVLFASFVTALAITFALERQVLLTVLGASLIVLVGLADDLGILNRGFKFVGQLIAAAVLVKGGVRIEVVLLPEPIAVGLSVAWLVTCMNAFNIVDVSDGLAATAALVGSAGMFCLAFLNHDPMIAVMSAALLGGCVGFLRLNWKPARMYLGDAGAMFLGTVLGALTLTGKYSETNIVSAFFAPISVVAIPLFDLTLVVVARARAGVPVYLGSPDHLAVRLRHHGLGPQAIAYLAAAGGILAVGIGIASTMVDNGVALVLATFLFLTGLAALIIMLRRFPPSVIDFPGTTAAATAPPPDHSA